MKPGARVNVIGPNGPMGGTVKIATDRLMTIEETRGHFFVLRRDPEIQPLSWRWAGVPVSVFILPDADFGKRLRDLKGRQPR